jgi:uncharacterized protein (DUF58 family)
MKGLEPPPAEPARGVYVRLDDLVRLRFQARGFSLKSRQPVHSLLTGRRASRLRGRGLDFEEIRAYLPGDDVRSIDWRVTARTGLPHTRVFTEERERPALLAVDQRLAMFYGTRLNLKSVTAAETAALAAWRIVSSGDRVGAVVFSDEDLEAIPPRRRRGQVLRILQAIALRNRRLRADLRVPPEPRMLNRALERIRQMAPHDFVVAIVSDFDGADAETTRLVTLLREHNDVLAVLVLDPSSKELPERGRLVVSGGELQIQVDAGKASEGKAALALASERIRPILAWTAELDVPVLPLSTGEDVTSQVRRLLGAMPRPRRA